MQQRPFFRCDAINALLRSCGGCLIITMTFRLNTVDFANYQFQGDLIMNETFGQRFQRLRKKANLTQEEVATKLNITAQAVSKWENDVSAPDISVLVEISDILGVTLNELLGKQTETTLLPEQQRKNINDMFFRVKVLSQEGDKVNVNIPLALAKVIVDSDTELPKIQGKDVLNGIDFKQLFDLIERGVVGKLVEVESKDGDFVEVWVE